MTITTKFKSIGLGISLILLTLTNVQGQQNVNPINAQLASEREKFGLTTDDISNYRITDQYTDRTTGLTYAYIQQRHNNVAVYNAISVFLIKDNKVLYFKPGMIDHLSQKVKTTMPSITPEAAIGYALINIGRNEIAPVKLVSSDNNTNTLIYDSPGLSASPIKVQLVYRAMDDGIYLAWDVSIELKNEPHWWNVRIDALTGNYLDKNDWTVSCNFDGPAHNCSTHEHESAAPASPFSPLPPPPPLGEYNVYPFPVEAPSFGGRTNLINPEDLTASPFGWHDDNGIAGNEYTITRGNNVHAYEDANNDNLPGYSPNSATLQFNYPVDLTQAPLVNQDASITNLFYLNNRIHDVLHHAGFTEVAGNFQENNYGNGGLGSDYVQAEAFDGAGTNNANFGTPTDGSNPRMQMFLWTAPTPDRDGSFDNGIVAHEYGHGVSNRLTGGPGNSSCLGNAEQGGEGWSDWLALMMTTEASDAVAGGMLTQARGIGTYALNQPTNGQGIRRFRYSVDMAINPQTYADLATSGTGPHNKGEIWCDAIWDMSSFLINDLGFNADPTVATAGNNIAMRLVLEGMKLQPCSPGFLDARDAILTADAVLYGNAHRCRIWQAFARRGMGFSAVQGSSNSSTDQTAAFDLPPFCLVATQPPVAAFTSNVSTIPCAGSVQFADASTQAFAWAWDFGDGGTSILANPSHQYTSPGTYNVKLVVTNPLGIDSVTHPITVTSTFSATVTALPNPTACGAPVQLNATGTGSTNATYALSSIAFAPVTGTPIAGPAGDDIVSGFIPIGFNFPFYNTVQTQLKISTNGFISFNSNSGSGCCAGAFLPNNSTTLSNLIAVCWTDLFVGAPNSIDYFNLTSPNRFVIRWNAVAHCCAPTPAQVTTQIILYETGEIEMHNTSILTGIDVMTMGIENANGTAATVVPGRNASNFTASNEAYRFTPTINYTYNWQPGNLNGPSQTVNPIASTTYTVNVADGSGCVEAFNTPLVTVNPVNVIIGGSSTFCSGGSTTLDAGSYSTYNWSTGATTQTITVNTAGTFTVSVTNAGGCSGSGSITTSISTGLTPVILGDLSICSGNTNILDAGVGFATYSWSTGATTQTIPVSASGTFTVTVSDGAGCSGTASAITTIDVIPSPTISGNIIYCPGTSSVLTTGLFAGYSWSTGATTQSISVNTAGTFTVTVSNLEGCTSSASVTTSNYTPPTPVITGAIGFCPGSSSTLDAGIYASYAWSTGATTQTITVNSALIFTVTVTDDNGCTASTSATTTLFALPNPVISGASTICDGATNILDAGFFDSYNWSTGSTLQTTSITLPGTYTVTVTDGNGCTKSATKTIVSLLAITPAITLNPNTPVCEGSSVTLTLDSTVTFTQINPITVPNTLVNATPYPAPLVVSGFPVSGVTVKSVTLNGVSHTFPDDLDILLQSPTGTNVILMSDVGGSTDIVSQNFTFKDGFPALSNNGPITGGTYAPTNVGSPDTWSAPGPGAFTQAAPALSMFNGDMNGTWNLLVTDGFAQDGGTINSWSITFESSNTNITYAWSPTTGLSNTTQINTTATPATTTTYTVTINDGISGCTTSLSATVNINPAPTPAISGTLAFCAGSSTSLDAGSYSSYLWSTSETTQSISVNTAGTFIVTVTDGNGCTGSASVTTTVNSTPTPAISSSLAFCGGSSTTLDAGSYSGYSWSTGASTQTISVNTAGTFTVTVTDGNGCTGSTSFTTTVCGGNTQQGSNCGLSPSNFAGTIAPTSGTTNVAISNYSPGTYFVMPLLQNGCYTISTCGAPFDTQIGCFQGTAVSGPFAWNDDNGPECSSLNASVNMTPNFTDYAGIDVRQYNCQPAGPSSITVNIRQNNNLLITSSTIAMCSGTIRTLTACPAPLGTVPAPIFGNPGTFSGTGVSGNVFTAPIVSSPTTYTISYTYGYVTTTQNITVNPSPTPTITGVLEFCAGSSTTLDAGSFASYLWSTSETTQIISVNSSGTFTVTVTGANGCTGSASVTTTVNALPTPSISGTLAFCAGSSTTLDAGSYSSYLWSTSETTQSISVNTSGTLTVTVTDGNGCTGSASVTTTVNAGPTPSISGATTFCSGNSSTLDAGSYSGYSWSTGETTQTISVNTAGTFTVTVTVANGCTGSASVIITVNKLPFVTSVASLSACIGSDIQLNATSSSFDNGSASPALAIPDNSLTGVSSTINLTGGSGNIVSTTPIEVTLNISQSYNNDIDAYLVGPGNCGAMELTTDNGGGSDGMSLTLHTTGAFANITTLPTTPGLQTGDYLTEKGVSIAPAGGSGIGAGSYSAADVPLISLTAGGCPVNGTWKLFVADDLGGDIGTLSSWSLSIASSSSVGNYTTNFSGAGTISPVTYSGVGNSQGTVTVTNPASGTYTVTTTDMNGCTSLAATTAVTITPLPTVSMPATQSICNGDALQLTASSSGGNNILTTTVSGSASPALPIPDASLTGAFSTINMSGSSGNILAGTPIDVTLNISHTFNGDIDAYLVGPGNCGAMELTTDNGSGSDGMSITLHTTGAFANITTLPTTPGLQTGDYLTEKGVSIAPAGGSGIGAGSYSAADVPLISLTAGGCPVNGTWKLFVADDFGALIGTLNSWSLSITNTGPDGNYTDVFSGAGTFGPVTYSGANNSQGTVTVTNPASGSYSVTTTDANGCISLPATTVVTINPLPTPVISGALAFCPGSSTTLDAGTFASYLWSTSETTQNISVSTAGTFTVTVTDGNGCTGSASVTTTVNALPTPSISGTLAFCAGSSTTLDAGTFASYLWSTSETTQNISVNTAGTITVTVTDGNGCTGSASVTTTVNPLPTPSISGAFVFCAGSSTTLDAAGGPGFIPSANSYLWSTGETTQTISVSTAGTFTVTVTDGNGCTGSASVTTTVNALPNPAITGSLAFCQGSSTTLDAGTYASYLWSTSETTQTISVNTAGTFTVTVTDGNGCTGSVSVTTTVYALPTPSISGNLTFCAGGSTILDAGSYAGYSWSTGATTQTISVNTAGTFTVTVTDANGCSGSASVTTTANINPNAIITGNLVFCDGSSTILDAGNSALVTPLYTYLWSTGAITQTISVNTAGTFTVTVTDFNGCSGSTSATTTVNALPTPSISGNLTFCNGGSTTLDAGSYSGYNWSSGETTQTISVNTAGTFTATVTDFNGCSGSTSATTIVNALPTPSISGNLTFCNGGSTTLDAGSYSGYSWSTGETTQTISVNTAGTFTVTVTDGNGCTSSASVTTIVNALPTPSISGTLAFCAGSSTTLDAGTFAIYLWSTSETTQSISVNTAGTFTVTVTDGNGCTGSASVTTTVNASPTPSINGSLSFCAGSSTTLDVGTYASYLWSTSETTQSISVNTAGTFIVTVTDGNGCTGSASVTTTVNASLTPSINGSLSFCAGSSTTLDAGTYASYLWSTSETTQFISVNTAGTFTVTVTDGNGCTGSASVTTTVNALPVASISGQSLPCNGSGAILSAGSFTSYFWSTGATTQSITVLNVGVYTVTVANANGCTGSASYTVNVAGVAPGKPATMSGSFTANCVLLNMVYSCSSVANATSYFWTVPVGVKIISGQGTNSITVNYTPAFNNKGVISVAAVNACGMSAALKRNTTARLSSPVISGPNSMCTGDIKTYTVASIPGALSYTWTKVAGSTILSGQGTTTVTILWGNVGGLIKCSANNACGGSVNGTYSVSKVCNSKLADSGTDFTEINLYPNPASTSATLQFDALTKGKGLVIVYDIVGQQVLSKPINVLSGDNQFVLDLNAFPKGIYNVRVDYNGMVRNQKLVVQ